MDYLKYLTVKSLNIPLEYNFVMSYRLVGI